MSTHSAVLWGLNGVCAERLRLRWVRGCPSIATFFGIGRALHGIDIEARRQSVRQKCYSSVKRHCFVTLLMSVTYLSESVQRSFQWWRQFSLFWRRALAMNDKHKVLGESAKIFKNYIILLPLPMLEFWIINKLYTYINTDVLIWIHVIWKICTAHGKFDLTSSNSKLKFGTSHFFKIIYWKLKY